VIFGTAAVLFGILLMHTLLAGSCELPLGAHGNQPSTEEQCARIAGTWIPDSSFTYAAYLAIRILAVGLIVLGGITIVLFLIRLVASRAMRTR
jgi:hypothetical protein